MQSALALQLSEPCCDSSWTGSSYGNVSHATAFLLTAGWRRRELRDCVLCPGTERQRAERRVADAPHRHALLLCPKPCCFLHTINVVEVWPLQLRSFSRSICAAYVLLWPPALAALLAF